MRPLSDDELDQVHGGGRFYSPERRIVRTLRNMTPDDHVAIVCAIAGCVLLGLLFAGSV